MSDVTIAFTLIAVALALFIWNKIPAVIVGIGVSLALFFTGILSANEALSGFGDPTVVLVAGLFVVSTGLEAAGVTTWAGQLLVETSGARRTRAFIFVCLLAALATATVSVNGAVASLLPATPPIKEVPLTVPRGTPPSMGQEERFCRHFPRNSTGEIVKRVMVAPP